MQVCVTYLALFVINPYIDSFCNCYFISYSSTSQKIRALFSIFFPRHFSILNRFKTSMGSGLLGKRKTFYCYVLTALLIIIPFVCSFGILVLLTHLGVANDGSRSGTLSIPDNASGSTSSIETSMIDVVFSKNKSSSDVIAIMSLLTQVDESNITVLEPSPQKLCTECSSDVISFRNSFVIKFKFDPETSQDPYLILLILLIAGNPLLVDNGIVSISVTGSGIIVFVCPRGFRGESCQECIQNQLTFPDPEEFDVDPFLKTDLSQALHVSLLNYNSLRSGNYTPKLLAWRDDSCFDCVGAYGEDLSGGHYEAGGSGLKIALPSCWTVTQLSWDLLAFEKGFEDADLSNMLKDTIKWELQLWINAHSAPRRFAAVFGNMKDDFQYPGPPELYENYLPSRIGAVEYMNESHAAAEISGECSAAMSAASLLFKHSDPEFADTLLLHSQQLYEWTLNAQESLNTNPNLKTHNSLYNSSGFHDEIVWASIWRYKATGDQSYLETAIDFYFDHFAYIPGFSYSWDEKIAAIHVLMTTIDEDCGRLPFYHKNVQAYFAQWLPGEERTVPHTPLGFAFRSEWGSCRLASNTAFLGFVYAKHIEDIEGAQKYSQVLYNYSTSQIRYILGETGQSFVVGVGDKYPQRSYFYASFDSFFTYNPDPTLELWEVQAEILQDPTPNKFIAWGYLVGGPENGTDTFSDYRGDFVHSEGALDYNAALVGNLAALGDILGIAPYSNCALDLGWDHPNAPSRDTPCTFRY